MLSVRPPRPHVAGGRQERDSLCDLRQSGGDAEQAGCLLRVLPLEHH